MPQCITCIGHMGIPLNRMTDSLPVKNDLPAILFTGGKNCSRRIEDD